MHELFVTGDPSPRTPYPNPTYRIPAVAVLPDRVLVAADVRADWKDLPGDFDIVARSSRDGGQTWSPQQLIRAHDDRGYGDASLIYAPATDRLWCFYVSAGKQGLFTGQLRLEHSVSNDRGDTWTHLGGLDLSIPADTAFATSGNGIALTSGRLVQPLVLRRGTELFAAMLFSDDSGITWQVGEPVGPNCDENKVVELPDGRLLLHARAKPRRQSAYSDDGGQTWSAPQPHPDLVDPACNGGLTRVGTTLVATALNHETDRADLVVRISNDDGQNWTTPVRIRQGACGYSCVQPLGNDVIVVWEDGDYQAICAAVLTLAQCQTQGDQPALFGGRVGAPAFAKRVAANPDRDE